MHGRTCRQGYVHDPVLQLGRYVCSGEHVPDTVPSFMIRCVVNLFLYDGAADPLPFARIAVLQYQ